MFEENEIKVRECVRCDYRDEQRFDAPKSELPTRVNKTQTERDAEVQPVRIIE